MKSRMVNRLLKDPTFDEIGFTDVKVDSLLRELTEQLHLQSNHKVLESAIEDIDLRFRVLYLFAFCFLYKNPEVKIKIQNKEINLQDFFKNKADIVADPLEVSFQKAKKLFLEIKKDVGLEVREKEYKDNWNFNETLKKSQELNDTNTNSIEDYTAFREAVNKYLKRVFEIEDLLYIQRTQPENKNEFQSDELAEKILKYSKKDIYEDISTLEGMIEDESDNLWDRYYELKHNLKSLLPNTESRIDPRDDISQQLTDLKNEVADILSISNIHPSSEYVKKVVKHYLVIYENSKNDSLKKVKDLITHLPLFAKNQLVLQTLNEASAKAPAIYNQYANHDVMYAVSLTGSFVFSGNKFKNIIDFLQSVTSSAKENKNITEKKTDELSEEYKEIQAENEKLTTSIFKARTPTTLEALISHINNLQKTVNDNTSKFFSFHEDKILKDLFEYCNELQTQLGQKRKILTPKNIYTLLWNKILESNSEALTENKTTISRMLNSNFLRKPNYSSLAAFLQKETEREVIENNKRTRKKR